ncbi:TolC family protein [Limnohabitans sp.]|uniref:TolC family protein n=1 Tax=Limnohabitans sp. TaxID=1907725 RepID=UPI0025E726CB|nr:TolC family protein [Limnohabitans sp.]
MLRSGPLLRTRWTLLQTWEHARQHDPQMQVVQATRSSVQAFEAQAQSLWRPVVMGSATVGARSADSRMQGAQFSAPGFGQSNGVSFGTSASAATSTRWSLQAKQALYSPERQAQQAQLQQAAGVAEWRADLAHQQFMLLTVQRYFQVLLADRQQQVLKNQHAAVQRSLTEARDRFSIGDLPVTDTHEAAARASGLQAQWLAADSELQMARQVLAESTRLPSEALKPQAPKAA